MVYLSSFVIFGEEDLNHVFEAVGQHAQEEGRISYPILSDHPNRVSTTVVPSACTVIRCREQAQPIQPAHCKVCGGVPQESSRAFLNQVSTAAQAETVFVIDYLDKKAILKRNLPDKQWKWASSCPMSLQPADFHCPCRSQTEESRACCRYIEEQGVRNPITPAARVIGAKHRINKGGRGSAVLIEQRHPVVTLRLSTYFTPMLSAVAIPRLPPFSMSVKSHSREAIRRRFRFSSEEPLSTTANPCTCGRSLARSLKILRPRVERNDNATYFALSHAYTTTSEARLARCPEFQMLAKIAAVAQHAG